MMKKHFYFLLMAALVCGLSLSVTSCKDDDKNDNGGGESGEDLGPQNEQNEASLKFWSVVDQLVDMDEYTEDYQNANLTPAIGFEDPNNAQARIVYTNSAEAAAERFANLVGVSDVDENTTSRTWSDPDVGTLTYTKVTDGTAWATVDVKIKQVPQLEKIIYREPSQGDENGGVSGGKIAYYRFGDVVSREVEEKNGNIITEYWICVRPAFNPEGKGDSHWVNVGLPLQQKNLWSWTYKPFEYKYVLPTGLGEDKEHMQNLAEMLYAIANPESWYNTVKANRDKKKFKFFHDFKGKNLDYHNQKFWQNVQNAWKKEGKFVSGENLMGKLFGRSELNDFSEIVGNLYLLYKGYSWKKGTAPTLFQAHYESGTAVTEVNNHLVKYTEVKKSVYNPNDRVSYIDLNFNPKTVALPFYQNSKFFGDKNPRYVVRIATGAQLSSTGKYPDNTKAIPGVTDIYRYYRDIEKPADNKPEETKNIIEL
jgi:hypothetical protein